jgi:hypothetical protein
MTITFTRFAQDGFVQVLVPIEVKSCTRTLLTSSAAADTYTTAEPLRFSSDPVELSVNVRLRVVPEAV